MLWHHCLIRISSRVEIYLKLRVEHFHYVSLWDWMCRLHTHPLDQERAHHVLKRCSKTWRFLVLSAKRLLLSRRKLLHTCVTFIRFLLQLILKICLPVTGITTLAIHIFPIFFQWWCHHCLSHHSCKQVLQHILHFLWCSNRNWLIVCLGIFIHLSYLTLLLSRKSQELLVQVCGKAFWKQALIIYRLLQCKLLLTIKQN